MDKKDFAFGRMNFILLGVGMLIVVIGFILMSGGSTTPDAYNPDIFSTRRIVVAPLVCFFGFVFMIYAVVHYPGNRNEREQVFAKEALPKEAEETKATTKPSIDNQTKTLKNTGIAMVVIGAILIPVTSISPVSIGILATGIGCLLSIPVVKKKSMKN